MPPRSEKGQSPADITMRLAHVCLTLECGHWLSRPQCYLAVAGYQVHAAGKYPAVPAKAVRSPGRRVDGYPLAPSITSSAPLTIASNSLRGTRARARIAMVWMVAEARWPSTLGSAAFVSSPFS